MSGLLLLSLIHICACGWPHYFYYYGAPDEKQLETVRYDDTANFARLLNVPGWFSWGYNDEAVSSTHLVRCLPWCTSLAIR